MKKADRISELIAIDGFPHSKEALEKMKAGEVKKIYDDMLKAASKPVKEDPEPVKKSSKVSEKEQRALDCVNKYLELGYNVCLDCGDRKVHPNKGEDKKVLYAIRNPGAIQIIVAKSGCAAESFKI